MSLIKKGAEGAALMERMIAQDRGRRAHRKATRKEVKRRELELTSRVRDDRITIQGGQIHEANGRHECGTCGRYARAWWVSSWRPASPQAPTIGHVVYSQRLCALCMQARLTPAKES